MRVITKLLLLLVAILMAPLAIALIWQNWGAALQTPVPLTIHLDWLTEFAPIYLFWGGVGLAIILLVTFIVALIWPRPKSLVLQQKTSGRVTVNRKAIENFTLTALKNESFIGNSKVSTNLSSNRVTINITGDLRQSVNARRQATQFLTQLEEDLKTCLGIETHKKIRINLTNFNSQAIPTGQARVI